MSAVWFLIIVCIVIAYIMYDTSKRNNKISTSPTTVAPLKKNSTYTKQCQILNEMALEKRQKINNATKIKVSVHISGHHAKVHDVQQIFQKLSNTMDIYLIHNIVNGASQLVQQLQALLGSRRVFKCKTFEGEVALIRQLSARIHIQTNVAIVKSLKPHLNMIATLKSTLEESETNLLLGGKNIISFECLSELFANIHKIKT